MLKLYFTAKHSVIGSGISLEKGRGETSIGFSGCPSEKEDNRDIVRPVLLSTVEEHTSL